MKILITGAKGNLGSCVARRLNTGSNELVLMDAEPIEAVDNCTPVQADIRDAAAVSFAMTGCHAVVHAAGYDQRAMDHHNIDDFYHVNVTGTHNVLRCMLQHNTANLIYCSSEAVYGAGLRDCTVLTELCACVPSQVAGLTKHLAEEMCRYYSRRRAVRVAMLRFGPFSHGDWKNAGLARLANGLDREDAAQAVVLALGAVQDEAFGCQAFGIHALTPFTDEDWPELEVNPAAVLDRYYPGCTDILASHGLRVPHLHTRYDITRAVTLLGYDPEYNFEQFLRRLRSH
ncbi:MAG: NAD(P)-dependent oxidoreductase [Armatimonadetes bacterium]|nr:NAD(P)-dependent oxidoreductase [Armatimonadota bacterium]MDE2208070.1 NAD(P)-dependent oxidoreductase [Armatimonadota bacterium]